MLRCDHSLLLRRHKVSALLHHFRAGHFPVAAGPMETIRLPLALNAHAKLPRALGHSHRLGLCPQTGCLAPELVAADAGPVLARHEVDERPHTMQLHEILVQCLKKQVLFGRHGEGG